tara:strand:+ start:352 stop:519 length:168 start_codon:yes stop_codon:yes gene_type:complete
MFNVCLITWLFGTFLFQHMMEVYVVPRNVYYKNKAAQEGGGDSFVNSAMFLSQNE